ncbi:MAG: 1-acyl-sn-glycerol-3-phosphate acyltransferase [Clostridia bacterium]|jgi:1-acyl-sn-glycerol-3-phosphate acyltransferase|nr:1-acyl-sn-glycerol-3-phosphate acyltransferase [Clostridia bacterium]
MIGNIKVINAMLISYISTIRERKKYSYGNKNYDKLESRRYIYALAQKLARSMLKAGNVTVEVQGMENLPKKGPVLYVANHKSIFDIVVLVSLINDPCIYIGKKEVAKMPIVGKWFDALGCIYIDREDIRQSLTAIISGINELKDGQSVVIFPEGTRTSSKEIKDFKEGSFKLATKTKVPIVPIALQDTYKIFEEKKGVKKAKVYVNIGEVIYQEQLGQEEKKKLPQYVQSIIETLLKQVTFDNEN